MWSITALWISSATRLALSWAGLSLWGLALCFIIFVMCELALHATVTKSATRKTKRASSPSIPNTQRTVSNVLRMPQPHVDV